MYSECIGESSLPLEQTMIVIDVVALEQRFYSRLHSHRSGSHEFRTHLCIQRLHRVHNTLQSLFRTKSSDVH